jgi:nitrogen-specific signal transduction histidine kinase
MNIREITGLAATLFNVVLTIFVLSRGLRLTMHRVYLLWGLSLILWNLAFYHLTGPVDQTTAFFWAKVLHLGVMFMPISLFHLSLLIAQIPIGRWLYGLYLCHLLFAASLFANQYIVGVRLIGAGYWAVPGLGFWIFMGFYLVLTSSLVLILYRKQRALPPIHRSRLRALLWGIGGLWLGGWNDLLPVLGFDYYPLTKIRFFPFGILAAVFYAVIVGYSVLQHQLLDIQVTLSRMAANLVRLSFMFLFGVSLLLIISVSAPEQFTPFSFVSALGVLLASAIVASVFFPRLFGKGDDEWERRILGDRFEYHDKVKGFIQSILQYSELETLLSDVHNLLVNVVKVGHYDILLQSETTHALYLARTHSQQPRHPLPELPGDSPALEFFNVARVDFLALKIAYAVPGETSLERAFRQSLAPFDSEFCCPLLVGQDIFGLLLFGEKENGDPYTPHDLLLMTSLCKNMSQVINQMRLKNQVLLAEEMELLGRMSRGMAHDLNNLLTTVWTFVQLARETPIANPGMAKLLPSVIRNVETVRAYVKEALFVSEHHTPQFQLIRLEVLIRKTIDLIESRLQRKKLSIQFQSQSEASAEIDEILLQRLIGNLLANAIDASPMGSVILIQLFQLPKSEADRDWLRLCIIDQGSGISAENLKRITTPYFTTKDHGDEGRGFGLGLAICRKIVHLHGGTLTIASQLEKGTTTQVDLPSRQNNRKRSVLIDSP